MSDAPLSRWEEKRDRQRGRLYPRQIEALAAYAHGIRYIDVARALDIAVGTARSYIGGAEKVLGASSPQEAVRIAVERGAIIRTPEGKYLPNYDWEA